VDDRDGDRCCRLDGGGGGRGGQMISTPPNLVAGAVLPDLQCTVDTFADANHQEWAAKLYVPILASTTSVWVLLSGKNMGPSRAANVAAKLTATQATPPSVDMPAVSLAPHDVYPYPLQKVQIGAGQVTFTGTMDPANKINEANKANNTCSLTVQVLVGTP